MEFAVHYSRVAAELLAAGRIAIDRFKCPAWPDLVTQALALSPVYIHFPLKAGLGRGEVVDTETRQGPDWRKIEVLLAQTDTPFVNIHLSPTMRDHPAIPRDSTEPAHLERVAACLIRDVQPVVELYGPGRVIVENDHDNGGAHLAAAYHPEVIRRVVEATGCGFLLDLAHARLAARALDMDTQEYVAALPLASMRELHLSGVQVLDAHLGFDMSALGSYAGRLMDHMPYTDADWELTAWAVEQVRLGVWGTPWIAALECGGVGPVWEATTKLGVLADQVPRLAALLQKT